MGWEKLDNERSPPSATRHFSMRGRGVHFNEGQEEKSWSRVLRMPLNEKLFALR